MRVIAQLAGFELAAGAWELHVLRARVADYSPDMLDHLSFTGRVAWARAARQGEVRREGPVRATPIALYPRMLLDALRSHTPGPVLLSQAAHQVRGLLEARGASFVDELSRASSFERALVEEALSELVAQGVVTSDGFMGMRALLGERDVHAGAPARRGGAAHTGRYALLPSDTRVDVDELARTLLDRWGVVFRKLTERETLGVPWVEVLRALRRMEAAGEVRGGRFVAGFSGEQYATSDAVSALRRMRREEPTGEVVRLSACDPLNLVGIIVPGARVPALLANSVVLCDGVPVSELPSVAAS